MAADVQRYGIRNSYITAIAPNTTSSLIQGCTASVLPAFKRVFTEKNSKGAIPNCPPFIKDSFWYYQENQNLDQKIVVQAISEMQKWIDTGISMELLFNLNQGVYFPEEPNRALTKEIYETLILAWESLPNSLPNSGYEEIKTIKGRRYRYWRWYENDKLRSKYLGPYEGDKKS